jgi:hypothetical protein
MSPQDFRHSSFHGRIGIARADITPPVGIYSRNWGAAKHDTAESIHRPLTLTAMTLTPMTGGVPLIFIDADLGWWKTPQTFHKFRQRLLEAVSLDTAQLIFALSHTHAGPPLMEPDESLPGSDLLRMWMEQLFQSTVDAINESLASQFEATLDWHQGRCGLAKVRDLPDPDTTKNRVVCGYNPAGEPDDTLLVGRITDMTGQIRGTLVNYACHPTTLAWDNKSISPDYVGAMRATIQDATNAPAVFMLGVCGELAPRYQYVGDPEVADRHGQQLGHAALATLYDMEPARTQLAYIHTVESGAPLAVWQHEPCVHRIARDANCRRTPFERMAIRRRTRTATPVLHRSSDRRTPSPQTRHSPQRRQWINLQPGNLRMATRRRRACWQLLRTIFDPATGTSPSISPTNHSVHESYQWFDRLPAAS